MLISSDPEEHRAADPEVPRPRLRPDLPPQRRPQPGRVDRGLRPRGPAEADGVAAGRRPRPAARTPEVDRMDIRVGALLWPQTDSWPELRDAALRADRAGAGQPLDVGPPERDRRAVGAADPRGLDDPRRPAPPITTTATARADGRREHVPQPGPDRQARDDPRPPQRRPGGPRHRRRLVRAGARGLRDRGLGIRLRRAARPARRGRRRSSAACSTASGSPTTAASTTIHDALVRAAAGPGPPADPDRRLGAAEDAPDDGPLRRRLEHRRHARGAASATDAMLRERCAEIGRDPDEIERTMSDWSVIRDDAAEARRVLGRARRRRTATSSGTTTTSTSGSPRADRRRAPAGRRDRLPPHHHGPDARRTTPRRSTGCPSSGRRWRDDDALRRAALVADDELAAVPRRGPGRGGGRLGLRLDVGPPARDLRAVGAADLRGLVDPDATGAVTKRIRLGLLVGANTFRNPG